MIKLLKSLQKHVDKDFILKKMEEDFEKNLIEEEQKNLDKNN